MYKYSIFNNKTLFQLSKRSISFLQGNMYMFSKVKPHKKEKTREDFVTPVNSTQTCVKAIEHLENVCIIVDRLCTCKSYA